MRGRWRRRRRLRLIGCSFGSSPPFVANVSSSGAPLFPPLRVNNNRREIRDFLCSCLTFPLSLLKETWELKHPDEIRIGTSFVAK